MRKTGIVMVTCAAVLAAGAAAAQSFRDCSNAATQLAATDCAHEGWQISDAELNRLWKIVKPAADARGEGQALLNAQRGWLKYRDSTCEAERDMFAGGSLAGQTYYSCLDRLTRQRNEVLRQMQP